MKYLLLFLFIPIILFAAAQETKKPTNVQKYPNAKWRKKVKMAAQKMNQGDYQSYYNAGQYLQDAYDQKPDKIRIAHLLATVKHNLRDYQAAEKYYKVVVDINPNTYANDRFYLGQMQKMNGKYEEAKITLSAFINATSDAKYKGLANVELAGCDTALALIKYPTFNKVVKTLGNVNTVIQDYSPKPLSENRVLFASQKTDTAVNIVKSRADHFSSIFIAEMKNGSYSNRTLLPKPLNDANYSTGNAIFSNDEQTVIFTKCTDSLSMGNRILCKLYRATKMNELDWNEPVELTDLNFNDGTTTHPAWGTDANNNPILYFVSNRKGGNGGLDIYHAPINSNGTFGAIVNAGNEINTPGDDLTPFYDNKNKVLYFSSEGHPGMGGLDIFTIAGSPGFWGAPKNAGVPINSSADDLYLALNDKSTQGFLVSNRAAPNAMGNATCCDDIWSVTMQHGVTFKGIYVKRDDANSVPLSGVQVVLFEATGDNFSVIGNNITDANAFTYSVKRGTSYKFNGTKEKFMPSIDNITVAFDEDRDTITEVFYLNQISRKRVKIPNVYFAFDKSNVIDFYKNKIDSVLDVMKNYPTYNLEIQAHTDSRGTDEYNQKLSERRAKEVDMFLTKKKKIGAAKISVKTYGETMPAVANELPDGEDDPEGRAQNRRVVFKILTGDTESAGNFENYGEVTQQVKTGPGFTNPDNKTFIKLRK